MASEFSHTFFTFFTFCLAVHSCCSCANWYFFQDEWPLEVRALWVPMQHLVAASVLARSLGWPWPPQPLPQRLESDGAERRKTWEWIISYYQHNTLKSFWERYSPSHPFFQLVFHHWIHQWLTWHESFSASGWDQWASAFALGGPKLTLPPLEQCERTSADWIKCMLPDAPPVSVGFVTFKMDLLLFFCCPGGDRLGGALSIPPIMSRWVPGGEGSDFGGVGNVFGDGSERVLSPTCCSCCWE